MATKKARQRISYVIENPRASAGGHRLGVWCVAADPTNNILYSGGKDGVICAWDINLDKGDQGVTDQSSPSSNETTTKFRAEAQAHHNTIRDLVLAQNRTAVVTASTDLTVKVWRPHSEEHADPLEIGRHADYANRLAVPPSDMGLNWVASGGLDRKVCLWDLNGGGKTLEIDTQGEDKPEKGSVYALSAGRNIIAVGSPEKTVRLYDSRSGTRFSKMVGHTDNIRSILIGDSGELILSASADKTIKMWSTRAGRCLYTFTMHDAPVWALRSDHPELRVFHSADRDGLIAKTDVRGRLEDMDNGLSLAVAQEHNEVWGFTVAGGHIWTATMQSSINRWADVDMDDYSHLRESMKRHRGASVTSRGARPAPIPAADEPEQKKVSPQSILQLSNTAPLPFRTTSVSSPTTAAVMEVDGESQVATTTGSHLSEAPQEVPPMKPIHQNPTETIEGQFGLLKHQLLNDRRRVLTVDTAGEVVMWDLIQCRQVESFGKMHLDEVAEMRNTPEAVAPWCHIDLASGNLTVVLEQYNCFDAEVYADQLQLEEPVEFREDQRISLGRWILRYLFANLIDEELKRDEAYRAKLNEGVGKRQIEGRANAPSSIALPPLNMAGWETPDQTMTPRADGMQMPSTTPGLAINQATPGPGLTGLSDTAVATPLSPLEKRQSHTGRPSGDHDYFTSTIGPADAAAKAPATPSTPAAAETADADKTKDKPQDAAKSPTSAFGKKFRMSFGTEKIGRSASQTAVEKPVIPEEKAEESETSSVHEKEVEDDFLGVIQKMHNEYDRQLIEKPDQLVETRMSPSLPNETPVLKLPPSTKIFIQEETSGGVANVYEGTIASVGADADLIEQRGPMWLGHVLLQNQITSKEPVKISFVLHPLGDLPPVAPADGNNRLNANRMLRVKKIIGYVVERIEQPPEEPEENSLKPEEYMELYCNGQLLDPLMSLATLRTHVWKSGNDIVLQYKANGRKEIRLAPQPEEAVAEADAGEDSGIAGDAQPAAPPAAAAQAS